MSLFWLLLLLPLGLAGYRLYRGSASLSARSIMLVMVGLISLSLLRGSLMPASDPLSLSDSPVVPTAPFTQTILLCRDCNSSLDGGSYWLEASAQQAELWFTRSTPFTLRFRAGSAQFLGETLAPGCHLLEAVTHDRLQLEVEGLRLEVGASVSCSD